jgi:hypothetical protein
MPEGFTISAAGAWILKDPGAILTYGIAFEDWLPAGGTLSTATWSVPGGITKLAESINPGTLVVGDRIYAANTVALVRLSGGTHASDYTCTVHITTNAGDEDERSIIVKVRNR